MQRQLTPENPIAAVTHPDPYPYYAHLVAHQPLYYDQTLGCWVASSADNVLAVLTSDHCRVRPPTEPVPKSLLGSPAADIFRHLIRMNDGENHHPFKQAVSLTLASVDTKQTAQQAGKWAQRLFDELRPDLHPERLSDFSLQLPVYVVASLLGFPEDKQKQIALWISEYVACVAPGSSQQQIERGGVAAGNLLDLFHSLLPESLLAALAREAKSIARDDDSVMAANAIGFMTQAYEATAGLIGNTLVTLASDTNIRDCVMAYPELLNSVVQEVLRYDSPVQNTRRFLAHDGIVAGQVMKEGDAILVLLAAANRDPSANPNPEQFDMFRKQRHIFTFGAGVHACPGETLATTFATAGIERLITLGIEFDLFCSTANYSPSVNVRIPLFRNL